MAIARQPNSLTFTATNDGVAFAVPVQVVGASFQGTGLSAGQQVTLRDSGTPGSGSVLADYDAVQASWSSADLWGACPQRELDEVNELTHEHVADVGRNTKKRLREQAAEALTWLLRDSPIR